MSGLRIAGWGVVSMGMDEPFANTTSALENLPIKEFISPRVSRRYGRLSKMVAIATHRALSSAGVSDPSGIPVVAATAIGEIAASLGILEQIHQTDGVRISPALVPNSVHNAAAGYHLIATKNRAPSLTVSQGWLSGEAAVATASDLLALETSNRVLVVAGDEADPGWVAQLRQHGADALADSLEGACYQEGATAWLLEKESDCIAPKMVAAVERLTFSPDGVAAFLSRYGVVVDETTEVRLRKNGGGSEQLKRIVAEAINEKVDHIHLDGDGPGTVQSAPLLSVAKHLKGRQRNNLLLIAAETDELGMVWLRPSF